MQTKSTEKQPEQAKFDSPEQEVYLNLWRTYDRLRTIEDRLFPQYDISSHQYNVLRLLKAAKPDPLPTLLIADRLISRAPDVTRMLDRLEARELIQRVRPAENRRQVLISITASGLRLLRSLEKPLHECHLRQLGHMSHADMKRLCSLLKEARIPHEEEGGLWS